MTALDRLKHELTAETVTDDQIRELRDIVTREDWTEKKGPRSWARVAICNAALAGCDSPLLIVRQIRMRNRAQCAEMLNARSGERSGEK